MRNTWIGRRILHLNLFCYLIAVGLLASALVIGYFTRWYVYNAVCGPFPVDEEALESLEDLNAQHKYFVTIRASQVNGTGVVEMLNYAPSTKYVHIGNGKKVLLVRVHHDYEGNEFTGTLETNPPFLNDVRTSLPMRQPEVRGKLLPFALDAVLPIRWKGWAIVILVLALAGGSGWLAFRTIRRMLDPLRHPIAKLLERHGPPEEIAAAIHAERPKALDIDGTHIGEHWIWRLTFGFLTVFRLDDIVWIYPFNTVDRSGKIVMFSYKVFDRHGNSMHITAAEPDVVRFLAEISRRLPWIPTNATLKLEHLWHINRPAFVEQVEQNRRQMTAGEFKAE